MAKRNNEKPATVVTPVDGGRGVNLRQAAFLAAFGETGIISVAARAAKIHRSDHYDWLTDPGYKERFELAKAEALENLEAEARRRAVEGVDEPVVYQGNFTYPQRQNPETGEWERDPEAAPLAIRKYSDTLLIFLMKGMMPEKYRDNAKVEHTGPGGAPLEVTLKFVKPTKA